MTERREFTYSVGEDQYDKREKLFVEIIVDMSTAYLKVLKRRSDDPSISVSLDGMESALNTVMPYIKKQLVAEMEAEGYKRDVFMPPDEVELVEELVGIVERFEL